MLISKERAREVAVLYYDDIYQFCFLRLQNEDDAHDVTQNIFLLFQERCDGLSDINIKNWLYSVADKKVKEQFGLIAKRKKEALIEKISDTVPSTELVYETELDNNIPDDKIDIIKNSIIASLTEKELRLFESVYIKHMKYSELAKALEVSESTVKMRVFRLKAKIKEKAHYIFMTFLVLIMNI